MKKILFAVALAACGGPSANVPLPPPQQPQPVGDPAAPPAEPAPTPQAEAPAPDLTFPDEEFRAKQPEGGAVKDLPQPPIARFKLKNGIEVFHVEDHKLPTVTMELVFEGGTVNDPKGKEGLASLCVGLMSKGTEKLDQFAFNEAMADLASSVSSFAGSDQQGVALATLKKNLDPTLDLWADTLLKPGMRKEDFDRDVKRRLEAIKQQKGSPGSLSGRLIGAIAWGDAHPYGRVVTEAATQAITVDDCKKYVTEWIKPQGGKLYVVGDVTRAEIEEKVGGRLAEWKGAPRKSVVVPKALGRKGKIFFVDVPGAPQASVAMVHAGPPRKAADYFATRLLSAILGGSFSSRINMNIREAKGWAYGARGGFSYARPSSIFNAGGSIKAEHTGGAIEEILKEIEGLRTGEATDEELKREKDGTILALPAEWATGRSVLGTYKNLIYFGLPLDWYKNFVSSVQKVNKAAVKKAATAHLKPNDLRIFVVGDGTVVLPQLKKLLEDKKLKGELVILDADGKVKPQ